MFLELFFEFDWMGDSLIDQYRIYWIFFLQFKYCPTTAIDLVVSTWWHIGDRDTWYTIPRYLDMWLCHPHYDPWLWNSFRCLLLWEWRLCWMTYRHPRSLVLFRLNQWLHSYLYHRIQIFFWLQPINANLGYQLLLLPLNQCLSWLYDWDYTSLKYYDYLLWLLLYYQSILFLISSSFFITSAGVRSNSSAMIFCLE